MLLLYFGSLVPNVECVPPTHIFKSILRGGNGGNGGNITLSAQDPRLFVFVHTNVHEGLGGPGGQPGFGGTAGAGGEVLYFFRDYDLQLIFIVHFPLESCGVVYCCNCTITCTPTAGLPDNESTGRKGWGRW